MKTTPASWSSFDSLTPPSKSAVYLSVSFFIILLLAGLRFFALGRIEAAFWLWSFDLALILFCRSVPSARHPGLRQLPSLIVVNLLFLILFIEIAFHFSPTLMPDFPRWNYAMHYYDFQRQVLDRRDRLGHERPAIFLLGDSFTRGAEVPRGKEWIALLQKRFRGCALINMGLGGSSTLEETILFRHHILSSKAGISAVVLIFNRTDFFDNSKHQRRLQKEGDRPFLDRLARQCTAGYPQNALANFISRFSCTYRLFPYLLSLLSHGNALQKPAPESGTLYIAKPGLWTGPLPSANTLTAQDIALSITWIEELRDIAISHRVPFLLVYLPMKEETYEAELRHLQALPPSAVPFEENRILLFRYLQRDHIPTIDLTRDFRERRQQALYLEYDLHMNEAGHALVAERLAQSRLFRQMVDEARAQLK